MLAQSVQWSNEKALDLRHKPVQVFVRAPFLGILAAMVVQQQSLNNLSAEQLREMVTWS